MARRVTISKEVILQAALNMLIRDGYSSINIKTLAKEIGCSTQPIAWHFENMEGLRSALADYTLAYAAGQVVLDGTNELAAFESMGRSYVRMAVREPNLFRFLYLGENTKGMVTSFKDIGTGAQGQERIGRIAAYFGITAESVKRYWQNTVIYSHGVATLVATGVIKATEEEMMDMINRAADGFLMQEGVPADKIPQ